MNKQHVRRGTKGKEARQINAQDPDREPLQRWDWERLWWVKL